ncbi:MAG: hypothetical protein [Olavius algarvensis Gamma 1 endosymbiont]|nr:MAG: hypothetical protein [Olavius algarvensis Gamma 1 endosymbiont]
MKNTTSFVKILQRFTRIILFSILFSYDSFVEESRVVR